MLEGKGGGGERSVAGKEHPCGVCHYSDSGRDGVDGLRMMAGVADADARLIGNLLAQPTGPV